MNDEIRAAVERLFSACLDVTLAGKVHAFIDYVAHCGSVHVYAFPSDTAYRPNDGRIRLLDRHIYIHEQTLMDGSEVERINALIVELSAYLQEDAA